MLVSASRLSTHITMSYSNKWTSGPQIARPPGLTKYRWIEKKLDVEMVDQIKTWSDRISVSQTKVCPDRIAVSQTNSI